MDEYEYEREAFSDFSKAFDINKKTAWIGIRGKNLEWAKDYLTNYKQKIKANNTTSSEREISYGVPEGSVMSALFIIYTNELWDWLQTDTLQGYANDTVSYPKDKTKEVVVDKLNTI